MVRLKRRATPDRRWWTVLWVTIWIVITYELPNKIVLLLPTPVPLLTLDTMIPFQPIWIWPYISYYVFLLVPYLVTDDEHDMNQMIHSYVAACGIVTVFYFAFPTILPRGEYPADVGDPYSAWVVNAIRGLDNSVSCFPSMHVALSTIAGLTLARVSRTWAVISLVWALLIFYSTVATKQHYVLDVYGGLAYGLGIFWFFHNCVYVEDPSAQLAHAVNKKNQP